MIFAPLNVAVDEIPTFVYECHPLLANRFFVATYLAAGHIHSFARSFHLRSWFVAPAYLRLFPHR
jgi:hypothetical protein